MRTRLGIMVLVVLALLAWTVQASEPVKAYKGLIFGEPQSETNKKVMADKSLQGNVWACFTKVGGEQYGVQFDFNEDRLYLIRLTSNFPFTTRKYGPQHFDRALAELDTLRRVIEAQYGPPHVANDISLLDMRDGRIAFKYAWNVDGVKAITIGVACLRYEYWAELSIGYIPILSEIGARESQEKAEQITGSASDF